MFFVDGSVLTCVRTVLHSKHVFLVVMSQICDSQGPLKGTARSLIIYSHSLFEILLFNFLFVSFYFFQVSGQSQIKTIIDKFCHPS